MFFLKVAVGYERDISILGAVLRTAGHSTPWLNVLAAPGVFCERMPCIRVQSEWTLLRVDEHMVSMYTSITNGDSQSLSTTHGPGSSKKRDLPCNVHVSDEVSINEKKKSISLLTKVGITWLLLVASRIVHCLLKPISTGYIASAAHGEAHLVTIVRSRFDESGSMFLRSYERRTQQCIAVS